MLWSPKSRRRKQSGRRTGIVGTEGALKSMDAIALYGAYRGYLEHEDELINRRLSWNLTLQGFLFAAYGVTLQAITNKSPNHDLTKHLSILLYLFPLLGGAVSTLSYMAIYAAQKAIDQLREDWNAVAKGLRCIGRGLPLPYLTGGGHDTANRYGTRAHLIPLFIILAWLVI